MGQSHASKRRQRKVTTKMADPLSIAGQPVRCEVDGPVATLTMDRPERRNAISIELVSGLTHTLEKVALREDIRIVVLTGEGDRFFCPGADLGGDRSSDARLNEKDLRASVLLHDMPQLTIAAVNGAAAGAGMGLATACDLRVASSTAMFNTAFLAVGVAGDFGLLWTLSQIVGPAKARELFFLRGKFDAHEAHRLGIVSDVFDPSVFRAEVSAIVDRLAAAAPRALATMKANFLAAERLAFADFFDLEISRHLHLTDGPEFREGVKAYVERRNATF